ncbi:MAG: hypothetical protein PUP92_02935 [Rhizonema sp. PD38]|nr:hypothetical protein [Rhizonema sp. PD38]
MQDEPPVNPFLTQLCKGYHEAEVAEIEHYMAEWDASTYISVSQSILDHASRKEFDRLKYLRKAHNFNPTFRTSSCNIRRFPISG